MASKFFEHFVYIAHATHDRGGEGISLWNEADGFFYDVLHLPDGRLQPLTVRSMVGLIPLFAVETIEPEMLRKLPAFARRMQWFIDNRPEFAEHVEMVEAPGRGTRRLLSIVTREQLPRVLRFMLDEQEFLSDHGVRSLSRVHRARPYVARRGRRAEPRGLRAGGVAERDLRRQLELARPRLVSRQPPDHRVAAEVRPLLRGRAQGRVPDGLGPDDDAVGREPRSVAPARRASSCEMPPAAGPRTDPVARFQADPHWRDLILFYEYFHGDTGAGLGASHQTGWTGLVAKLMEQYGRRDEGG